MLGTARRTPRCPKRLQLPSLHPRTETALWELAEMMWSGYERIGESIKCPHDNHLTSLPFISGTITEFAIFERKVWFRAYSHLVYDPPRGVSIGAWLKRGSLVRTLMKVLLWITPVGTPAWGCSSFQLVSSNQSLVRLTSYGGNLEPLSKTFRAELQWKHKQICPEVRGLAWI